jgi:hypothetical protein
MSSDSEPPPTEIYYDIVLPEDLQPGEYANFLTVWHTGHEFTLDFSATQPTQPVPKEDGSVRLRVPCRVVVRVKIPPTLVFDIIRALSTNMTAFEQRYGAIRRTCSVEQVQAAATLTMMERARNLPLPRRNSDARLNTQRRREPAVVPGRA